MVGVGAGYTGTTVSNSDPDDGLTALGCGITQRRGVLRTAIHMEPERAHGAVFCWIRPGRMIVLAWTGSEGCGDQVLGYDGFWSHKGVVGVRGSGDR